MSRDLVVVASTSGDVTTLTAVADGDGRVVAICRTADELTLHHVTGDSLA